MFILAMLVLILFVFTVNLFDAWVEKHDETTFFSTLFITIAFFVGAVFGSMGVF